jgi:hypothetical protein
VKGVNSGRRIINIEIAVAKLEKISVRIVTGAL